MIFSLQKHYFTQCMVGAVVTIVVVVIDGLTPVLKPLFLPNFKMDF